MTHLDIYIQMLISEFNSSYQEIFDFHLKDKIEKISQRIDKNLKICVRYSRTRPVLNTFSENINYFYKNKIYDISKSQYRCDLDKLKEIYYQSV